MKWLFFVALTIAAGSSLTFLVWQSTASPPEPGAGLTYVESSHGSAAVEGIGYVEPASEVRQLAPKTGGVIKVCYVKVGDVVRKGAPILALHDEKETAAVALARTQLVVTQAEAVQVKSGVNPYRIIAAEKSVARFRSEYDLAVHDADRTQKLISNRAASQSDLDAAEARRLQAAASLRQAEAELLHLKHYVREVDEALVEAKVRQAEANLQVAEQQLRDLLVVAPCDGTVLKFLKRPGEGARMFDLEPVVLFGDLSRLRVRAEVDERFVKELHISQRAEVYGRNLLGKTYPGRVIEVEKIMGDKTLFTRASSERKDLHVLQVVIEMEPDFAAPVGLQVDVRVYHGN